MHAPAHGRVAILLSTFNGAQFLTPQLHSLLGQTHRDWVLYWRDDGSCDATRALMRRFLANLPAGQSVVLDDTSRMGSAASFLRLLRVAVDDGLTLAAFADQDDVWLPEKLARGAAAMADVTDGRAGLYCARQVLVDADLRRIALSFRLRHRPGFPLALTQNVATGCTIMLNRVAMEAVAGSRPPRLCQHDWWSYLVVAAGDGFIVADPEPVVLYRQHGSNTVGAPASIPRRAVAALRRGPAAFMQLFRGNVAALQAQPELLSPCARAQVAAVDAALNGGLLARLAALRMPGLHRQSWAETVLFRLWFLLAERSVPLTLGMLPGSEEIDSR
jgi:hypothetical protein